MIEPTPRVSVITPAYYSDKSSCAPRRRKEEEEESIKNDEK